MHYVSRKLMNMLDSTEFIDAYNGCDNSRCMDIILSVPIFSRKTGKKVAFGRQVTIRDAIDLAIRAHENAHARRSTRNARPDPSRKGVEQVTS